LADPKHKNYQQDKHLVKLQQEVKEMWEPIWAPAYTPPQSNMAEYVFAMFKRYLNGTTSCLKRLLNGKHTRILKQDLMLHTTTFLQKVIESKGELQLEAIMGKGFRGYGHLYESLEHDLGQIE
jgi:hypothetical protein